MVRLTIRKPPRMTMVKWSSQVHQEQAAIVLYMMKDLRQRVRSMRRGIRGSNMRRCSECSIEREAAIIRACKRVQMRSWS